MADTKITALAAIATVDPAADVLPIVDISDTSMAASGTTKKVTTNQILQAGGTATLASATITGDLTVDTSTLFVNSSNDRVGVGTVSPNNTLTVRGSQDAGIEINSADSNMSRLIFAYDPANTRWYINSTLSGSGTTLPLTFLIQNTEALRLNTTGNLVLKGGTVGATGVGLTFPATQVASSDANCLDDYVESTFSPTIVGSTIAGTATYSMQIGRATKVGRLVTFSLRVAYTAGLGTGNLRVGNLPFTAGVGSIFTIYTENIALTAGNIAAASMSAGNTYISIDQLPTGGGGAASVPYDVAGDIQISGSYIV